MYNKYYLTVLNFEWFQYLWNKYEIYVSFDML